MKKLVLLPLLLLLSLLPFSFNTYAADFSCEISHGSLDCTEDRPIDYKAAGQGLRNILRWLNENSTNTQKTNIPANAYAYKNTWKCYDGYKKSGNRCTKQSYKPSDASKYITTSYDQLTDYKIPQNAYRTKGTWKCLASFVKSGNTCIKASVNGYAPSNSYVLSSGEWKCNTGFKKSGNSCIKNYYIPLNGYASGSSFKCNNGFKKSGIECLKNEEAPNNSYVLSSGEWKCNAGFKKIGNECLLSKVSNEGFLEDTNDYLEEIKKAKVLLDSGVITETEFKEIKKRIINKI